MSETLVRQDVLDLLARGKISIDEAVELLSRSSDIGLAEENEDPVYKAEVIGHQENVEALKVEEMLKADSTDDTEFALKEKKTINASRKPRWLRVRVSNLESGKSKVSVNVPFAMVKFGLGIARVFSPEINGTNLDEINDMFLAAEQGLLVDVEDAESNEHVQIYLD